MINADNEKKQCIALLTAIRFRYDPSCTDSPTYRFIQCCDLLGCSYLLRAQPAPSRWDKLPRIKLREATPSYAWPGGDLHHFMSWHSDLDQLMMRLTGEQFEYIITAIATTNRIKENMAITTNKLLV